MELWIRSQDKKSLVKVSRLDVSALTGNGELTGQGLIRNLYDKDEDWLGIYATEERALEVLDEITKRKDELDKSYFLGMEEASFVSSIYEMPEE